MTETKVLSLGILTVSGEKIDFTNLSDNNYKIEDIAFALSNICRYGGHCRQFYSVAQHCVLMSKATEEHAMGALLHDAAEAYMGDMCKPLKMLMPDFLAMEKALDEQLAKTFGIPFPMSMAVKHLDTVMLATECRDMMPSRIEEWGYLKAVTPLPDIIYPWSPERARAEFMSRYLELRRKL